MSAPNPPVARRGRDDLIRNAVGAAPMIQFPDNTSALASKSLVLAQYLSSFRQRRAPPVFVNPFASGAPAVVLPPDGLRTPAEAARKPRKPTLARVAKDVRKAGIEVARYEVKPDGTVVAVVGKPESAATEDPWPLDEFRTKETKQ
jgi:hypothetical protein